MDQCKSSDSLLEMMKVELVSTTLYILVWQCQHRDWAPSQESKDKSGVVGWLMIKTEEKSESALSAKYV